MHISVYILSKLLDTSVLKLSYNLQAGLWIYISSLNKFIVKEMYLK